MTNQPERVPAIAVWRDYNGRAGCEEVIKQLDADFALPKLCPQKFWSTEAALCLAIVSYNLCVLFQRHLGWLDRVNCQHLALSAVHHRGHPQPERGPDDYSPERARRSKTLVAEGF